jgi:neutral ceramidase
LPQYAKTAGSGRALVHLPVRFLQIGGMVMWSAPVELFSEISMNVRKDSPFANTFYAGYTNGWFGYLPTAKAFSEGGYEPATSPFTEAAEADLTRHVIAHLKKR